MYEELIQRLRSHNGWALNKTLDEAADAIESTNKAYQMISEAYEAEVTKQNWIPVTERLPEESEGLNWHEDMMIRFTSVWCCDAKTGTIEVRNRFQHKITGIQFLDLNIQDTDWHWSKSGWEPTHWMPIVPLPEPPEEK